MALINCPECGKEISDRAECCIHCGYPLSDTARGESKFYKLTLFSYPDGEKLTVIQGIRLIFNLGLAEAKEASENLPYELCRGLYYDECARLKESLKKYSAETEIIPDLTAYEHNDFLSTPNMQGENA